MCLVCICKHMTCINIFRFTVHFRVISIWEMFSQSVLDVYYYFQWWRAGKGWFHSQLCEWGWFLSYFFQCKCRTSYLAWGLFPSCTLVYAVQFVSSNVNWWWCFKNLNFLRNFLGVLVRSLFVSLEIYKQMIS